MENIQQKRGDKLPKYMWEKGKSKFFYPRLKQEGIELSKIPWWVNDSFQSAYSKLYLKLKKKLKVGKLKNNK